MSGIVSFGEIMMRLSAPGHQRLNQSEQFSIHYGGAEYNVLAALAQWGHQTKMVTSVPDNDLGLAVIQRAKSFGIDTNWVQKAGSRLGIYFLESGIGLRPSRVIYDRAHSSFSEMKPGNIDWESVFQNQKWFHWTGITPALGKNISNILEEALIAAKKLGLTISTDLNYRATLWSESEAQAVMPDFMKFVDVCIANEEHAKNCLNFEISGKIEKAKIPFELARQLREFYGFSTVAITQRSGDSASQNKFSVIYSDQEECQNPIHSTEYDILIEDRVGGGDAFTAGLIHGLIKKWSAKDTLEFAVAAAALKHTIPGDVLIASESEVENLISSGGGGRVVR